MPTARSDLGVVTVGGNIYAIGGELNGSVLGINEMYDPNTNTWTTKEPMPTARAGFGIAVYQNKIHIMGGYIPYQGWFSGAHEIYDPLTNTWETKNETDFGGFFCANVVGEKLYVMGGLVQYLPPAMTKNQLLVYDSINDSWTNLTPMPIGVADFASAVVNNKIYVFGGRSSSVNAENISTQIYDPVTDIWSTGTRIPSVVFNAAASATYGINADEKIYVFGGLDYSKYLTEEISSLYDPRVTSNLTQTFDPETNSWNTEISMPTSRYNLGVANIDDRLYVIGGKSGGEIFTTNYYINNELYTPSGYVPESSSSFLLVIFFVTVLIISIKKFQS
jgi:N-acetylneuraminic acid mutarotase